MISHKNETIPRLLYEKNKQNPQNTAQLKKNDQEEFVPITFHQLWLSIREVAGGFLDMGVKEGDRILHVSDNNANWMSVCLATGSIGAVDMPTPANSTKKDIEYIISHATPKICVLESYTLYETLHDCIPKKTAIVITQELKQNIPNDKKHTVLTLSDVKSKNALSVEEFETTLAKGAPQDLSTIIYTSGTTGTPKGVMLTHRNFTFQLEELIEKRVIGVGDIVLCILPIWHSFERIANLLTLVSSGTLAYSRPVASVLVQDMQKVKPTILPAVPRLWDAIRLGVLKRVNKSSFIRKILFYAFLGVGYANAFLFNLQYDLAPRIHKEKPSIFLRFLAVLGRIVLFPFYALGNILVFKKIKSRLGGRFRLGVSGAGALQLKTYLFYQAIGITICEGYGLTETAPVVSINNVNRNRAGTVGQVLNRLDYKILNTEGSIVAQGEQGELLVKGESIMRGYYQDPETTSKVVAADGWLRTGDLVLETKQKDLKIIGRLKDTIVLSNGKNVEPGPIESAICESQHISDALVVGQDQNSICALIFINKESIQEFANERGLGFTGDIKELCSNPEIHHLIRNEINFSVNTHNGFHLYELISKFAILSDTLEIGKELSKTMKLKRFYVIKKYESIIESLY